MALKANVHIETVVQQERTILKRSFCSSPFKIADVTENKEQSDLRLMLMTSSPGVLDNDVYDLSINLKTGSQVRLETQSYQRIFQMKSGAGQSMQVTMEEGSSLIYLPHPVVPHKHAIFKSKNKIYLNESCSLLWSDIISCGRKQNNEVFEFESYHSVTEIFLKGKLVVKENLLLRPGQTKLDAIGQLEGYTHQATLLYWNETTATEALIQSLVDKMELETGITFGLSVLPVCGLIVRLLGNKAEQLFNLLHDLSFCIESFQPKQANKIVTYVGD